MGEWMRAECANELDELWKLRMCAAQSSRQYPDPHPLCSSGNTFVLNASYKKASARCKGWSASRLVMACLKMFVGILFHYFSTFLFRSLSQLCGWLGSKHQLTNKQKNSLSSTPLILLVIMIPYVTLFSHTCQLHAGVPTGRPQAGNIVNCFFVHYRLSVCLLLEKEVYLENVHSILYCLIFFFLRVGGWGWGAFSLFTATEVGRLVWFLADRIDPIPSNLCRSYIRGYAIIVPADANVVNADFVLDVVNVVWKKKTHTHTQKTEMSAV